MPDSNITLLVAMSGFKGKLTNVEACAAVAEGLKSAGMGSTQLPIADGGRGTMETVHSRRGSEYETFSVTGPLGRPVQARVLCFPDKTAPKAVLIETPEAAGHHLIAAADRDPMRATSFGVGELIKACAQKWKGTLERVYVGLGDSAVSDAGMGMLSALGFQFFDESGRVLWGNATGLRHIRSFKPFRAPWLDPLKFTVLCDVMNPLCGPQGSARVFGPQKGASVEQVRLIEQGMDTLARLIENTAGRRVYGEPMTGSAGGMSAAFLGFLNGELVHGARFLLDWIEFDKLIAGHDGIVTGEGKSDQQTMSGKAPWECLERAARYSKRTVLISGALGPGYEALGKNRSLLGAFACGENPSAAEALKRKTSDIFSAENMRVRDTYASLPSLTEGESTSVLS